MHACIDTGADRGHLFARAQSFRLIDIIWMTRQLLPSPNMLSGVKFSLNFQSHFMWIIFLKLDLLCNRLRPREFCEWLSKHALLHMLLRQLSLRAAASVPQVVYRVTVSEDCWFADFDVFAWMCLCAALRVITIPAENDYFVPACWCASWCAIEHHGVSTKTWGKHQRFHLHLRKPTCCCPSPPERRNMPPRSPPPPPPGNKTHPPPPRRPPMFAHFQGFWGLLEGHNKPI